MDLTSRYYKSHGKLLLTAEYLVLKGSLALSMPVNRGQSLRVTRDAGSQVLSWSSFAQGKQWFSAIFQGNDFSIENASDPSAARLLAKYLKVAHDMNPRWFAKDSDLKVETSLDFPLEWGFGSSSTLISNLAFLADLDLFDYYFRISKGSGYDVASARSNGPILYRLREGLPEITRTTFDPPFAQNLFFLYSGRKQSSDESVVDFISRNKDCGEYCDMITSLTEEIISVNNLSEFNRIIREHEKIIASVLGIQPVKDLMFQDFRGEIKSLGAWGGDFYLVTWDGNPDELRNYFAGFGLQVILPFSELTLMQKSDQHGITS